MIGSYTERFTVPNVSVVPLPEHGFGTVQDYGQLLVVSGWP